MKLNLSPVCAIWQYVLVTVIFACALGSSHFGAIWQPAMTSPSPTNGQGAGQGALFSEARKPANPGVCMLHAQHDHLRCDGAENKGERVPNKQSRFSRAFIKPPLEISYRAGGCAWVPIARLFVADLHKGSW